MCMCMCFSNQRITTTDFFFFCLFLSFSSNCRGLRVQISVIDNRGRLFPLWRQSLFVVLPRLGSFSKDDGDWRRGSKNVKF